ncbi:hypothetical protein L914_21659, partial [Phytophthora nicotianae]
DLDRQLVDAAKAASPYVLLCQHKYEVVHHQLDSTRKELADCLNALEERLDNSRELEACRLRYHDLQLRYDEAVSEFQDRVARGREAFLTSELRESATSLKVAQAEVDRLEATVQHKTCRFHEGYEHRLKVAFNTITTHSAELARLQDRVSTLDPASFPAQDRVSGARDTIARLERRINQVDKSRKSRQDLETVRASLRQERARLVVQKDDLLSQLDGRLGEIANFWSERDQAQERLSNIASLLLTVPSQKRARSESSSPAQFTRYLQDRPIDFRFFPRLRFDPGSGT